MNFDSILNSSLFILIVTAIFYYFGYFYDSKKSPKSKEDIHILGFLFVLIYVIVPLVLFFIFHGRFDTRLNGLCDFISNLRPFLDYPLVFLIYIVIQVVVTSFIYGLCISLNPLFDTNNSNLPFYTKHWKNKLISILEVNGNVKTDYRNKFDLELVFISWAAIIMGLYYSLNPVVDSVHILDSDNLLIQILKLFVILIPLIISLETITLIAVASSLINNKYCRVKVFLLDNRTPIDGKLLFVGDIYVKVLDDSKKLIQINKDSVKLIEYNCD